MSQVKKTFEPIEGGCSCQQIRYQLHNSPLIVHCCHCTWCQRESGSAFALNAMIEASEVSLLSGNPEYVDTPTNSGKTQRVARCPNCKIALWSHYAAAGDAIYFLRVGTLESSGQFAPDIHIFTSTKRPWVLLPNDKPAVPEFYKLPEQWPDASMARLKALQSAQQSQQ